MTKIAQTLRNINVKDPHSKKVPIEIWVALVDLVEEIEKMDMELKIIPPYIGGGDSYYEVDGVSGNDFITALAVLDEVVWENIED